MKYSLVVGFVGSLAIVAGIAPELYIHATTDDRIQTCMFAYGVLIYCQILYSKG